MIGSTQPSELGADPQQELPPALIRTAALALFLAHVLFHIHVDFSLTVHVDFPLTGLRDGAYLQIWVILAGLMALFRVQHSA